MAMQRRHDTAFVASTLTDLAVGGHAGAAVEQVAAQLRRQHAQDAALDDARQRGVEHKPARTVQLDVNNQTLSFAGHIAPRLFTHPLLTCSKFNVPAQLCTGYPITARHLSRVRGSGTLLPRTVRSRCTISTCTEQAQLCKHDKQTASLCHEWRESIHTALCIYIYIYMCQGGI